MKVFDMKNVLDKWVAHRKFMQHHGYELKQKDEELERMRRVFRELRAVWYAHVIHEYTFPDEGEESIREREELNEECRREYDEQTEKIIMGKFYSNKPFHQKIAPRSIDDVLD